MNRLRGCLAGRLVNSSSSQNAFTEVRFATDWLPKLQNAFRKPLPSIQLNTIRPLTNPCMKFSRNAFWIFLKMPFQNGDMPNTAAIPIDGETNSP